MSYSIHSNPARLARRKLLSHVIIGTLTLFAVLAVVPLFSVFIYAVINGVPALTLEFFTELPKPVGEPGGGMANAIVGSFKILLLASCIGVPWGIATGIYLAEYKSRLTEIIRAATDLLTSVPSIIVGLFIYIILVVPMGGFSGYAGSVALSILMIPTIARATEEVLKLIPQHIREAGLALGLPRWKVTLRILLRTSKSGILTGVILAVARVAGETAPLLFTAFNNQFWAQSMSDPTPSLPVQIYTYAISPFDEWHTQAWAGALVLILFVFSLNLICRLALRNKAEEHA